MWQLLQTSPVKVKQHGLRVDKLTPGYHIICIAPLIGWNANSNAQVITIIAPGAKFTLEYLAPRVDVS